MKLNLLAAVLAATAVFALPTIHTNSSCRLTSLTWSVSKLGESDDLYNNTFTYDINYLNGQPNYHSSLSVELSSDSGGRSVCQDDGVWCVTYSGWAKSDRVTIKYAGVDLGHDVPDSRYPFEYPPTGAREDYIYLDCVPW